MSLIRKLAVALGIAALLALPTIATATPAEIQGFQVTACPSTQTPPSAVAGSPMIFVAVDPHGNLCSFVNAGSGGVTSNVTILGPLGTGSAATGVRTTLDATDAAALQSLVSGVTLNAGTAIVGKFGIDQTTPGTTNGVYITNASAPAPAAPPNDVLTGPITCSAACAVTTQVNTQGAGSVGVVATGTNTGVSFTLQASVDGTTWFNVQAYTPASVVVTPGTVITGNGQWTVPASGWRFVRANLTAIGTGSIIFNLNASAGSVVPPGASVTLNAPPNDVLTGPTACTSTSTCTALTVNAQGAGSVGISLTGTGSGMAFTFQGSEDGGTTWFSIACAPTGATGTPTTTGSANGNWACPPAGVARLLRVDMTAFTSGTETITLNASAGSIPPMLTASGGQPVDIVGNNGAAVSASNPLPARTVASTSGGANVKRIQVANNTTSISVCSAACTLFGVRVWNNSGTIAYLKLYNIAQGSTTCGTSTVTDEMMIPANTSGAGAVIPIASSVGDAYGTALSVCITTGFADNDSTAPAATTYIVSLDTK